MNNIIYLWINKYRLLDKAPKKARYLFNDCGISLSSKYEVSTSDNKGKRVFTIRESESNILFPSNENASQEPFYSECITDLKIIVGKNGVGKSSILNLLCTFLSHDDDFFGNTKSEYLIIWQKNDKSFHYRSNLQNVAVKCDLEGEKRIASSVLSGQAIFYSAAFHDEWTYPPPTDKYSDVCDLSTRFLIQQDVRSLNGDLGKLYGNNDQLSCHATMESIRQVTFASIFSEKKDFIKSIFKIPNGVIFSFSTTFIKNAIHDLFEDYTELKKIDPSRIDQIINDWVKFIIEKVPLELRIASVLVFSDFRRNYQGPFLEGWKPIDVETRPTIEHCERLIEILRLKLGTRLYKKDIDSIKRILKRGNFIKIKNEFWFNLSTQREDVVKLLKLIAKIKSYAPLMEMSWNRPMSSGELCYLRFFSRLYDRIKETEIFATNKAIESQLLIDEIDLHLHPEWQRKWFSKFVEGLKLMQEESGVKLHFQLIMTTHSPFMLTDFFYNNVTRLDIGKDGVLKIVNDDKKTQFLAGNIYDILSDGFFLDGSMGFFIKEKLKGLLQKAERPKQEKNVLDETDKFLFNNIGDPLMKALDYQRIKCKV